MNEAFEAEVARRAHAAIEAALRSGSLLRANLGRVVVEHKGELELVTETDRQSERMILEMIQASFPEDSVLAEEGGARAGGEFRWLIDPLDGTTNYAHGLPHFSVSLAGEHRGEVCFGVVYDPMRDELFRAVRGGGAFLNDLRLRVSPSADLGQSLLVTGFPYDLRSNPDNNLDRFARLSSWSRAVRRLGSAALDLAYVAAGRFDGYWELRLEAWDLAAGILLVTEAGGQTTRLDGSPNPLRPPTSIVASNGRIHQALVRALAGETVHG